MGPAVAGSPWAACTKLEVQMYSSRPQPMRQLPRLPLLLDLDLQWASNITVQLGPAGGYPGVLQGCSQLTSLALGCNILDAPQGVPLVDSLSTLVHLQHLEVAPRLTPSGLYYSVQGLHAAVLPSLSRLTYLSVRRLSVENLLQLGVLSELQYLCLDVEGVPAVGPSSVPGLVIPASLTKLEVLADIEAGLLSLVPTGLHDLSLDGCVSGPAEGPGSILSCLASLQCLTQLRLDVPHGYLAWPAPGPAFTSLTASSSLAVLSMGDIHFPVGAWQYVFPAARQLPHLTCLDVGCCALDWGEPAPAAAWGPADLRCLVSCCPNLRCVNTESGMICLKHGLHVSELQKLTALTSINIQYGRGSVGSFKGSIEGLAAVTQLRSLELHLDTAALSMGALFPLTRLTALTLLDIQWHPNSTAENVCCCARGDRQDGAPPDVWLQLLELCAADPCCQPKLVCSLAQQVAEQQAVITQQQQQNAGQQRTISEQQQQLAGAQQQLSGVQQAVAAQDARITGLEGQLQEMRQQLQLLLQRQNA